MKKSPLALVKEQFKDKAELVKAVQTMASKELWLRKDAQDQDANVGEQLQRVSNRKLLHLHQVLSDIKSQFGSRAALTDAILKLEHRAKDEGFRKRLEGWSTPRLWDAYRAAKKRSN
jgi:hypothetical protein